MHPSVVPLAAIFRLNTELLLNCADGLDDTTASLRMTGETNSLAFLAAHLVDSRHFIARQLKAPLPNPLPPSLLKARSLDQAGVLPPLSTLLAHWEAISAHVAVEIERLDTPRLHERGQAFPGADGTLLGALAFLAQHESYHIGQMALLRRQYGAPAMSYLVRRPREPGRAGA